MLTRTWKSVAAACTLAIGAITVAPDPADAGYRYRHHRSSGGAAIAGAAIGFAAGALIAGAARNRGYGYGYGGYAPRYGYGYGYGYPAYGYGRGYGYARPYYGAGYYYEPVPRRVYRAPRVYSYRAGLSSHQARCLARYRTYDVGSDTYIANSRGERRYCRL